MSAVLRDFVELHRSGGAPSDFPYKALDKLEHGDADMVALLFDLFKIAERSSDEPYEGEDLRRKAAVLRALSRCEPAPAIQRTAADTLRSLLGVSTRYHAQPGSPAADKFDRDESVETGQDHLAMACVVALFHQKQLDTDSTNVLRQAEKHHRAFDVQQAAGAALYGRR